MRRASGATSWASACARDAVTRTRCTRGCGPSGRWSRPGWATGPGRAIAICNLVLRDRQFGVRRRPEPGRAVVKEEFDISFLSLNQPDHTRLRRVAMPAFIPRRGGVATRSSRRSATCSTRRRPRGVRPRGRLRRSAADRRHHPDDGRRRRGLGGVPALRGGARQRPRRGRRSARRAGSSRRTASWTSSSRGLFEQRHREPGDDLVSHVADKGDRIRPAEMMPMCSLLLWPGSRPR